MVTPNHVAAQSESQESAESILKILQTGDIHNVSSSPVQLEVCPYCGKPLNITTSYWIEKNQFHARCSDNGYPFHDELPVVTVDDDIYERRPALLISTIDKFARLAWEKKAGSIFAADGKGLPSSLLIQDELHLISGSLSSISGLYEIAIEQLCSKDGTGPKIIASTATVCNAEDEKWRSRDVASFVSRQYYTAQIASTWSMRIRSPGTNPARQYAGNRTVQVPSRFIVVCPQGHLDDLPYDVWVHRGSPCPGREKDDVPKLKLKNIDGRNSIGSLMVFCDHCGNSRGMQDALTADGLKSVYRCSGRRPWLKIEYDRTVCRETPVTQLRIAAGVYMPAAVSALNIPPWTTKISRVLRNHLDGLYNRTDEQALDYISAKVMPYLSGTSADEVLSVWKVLSGEEQTERPGNEQELYEDEYTALCEETDGRDVDFQSKQKEVPAKYSGLISRIFVVTRLTEVVATLGFTRVKRWNGDYRSKALAPIFSQKDTDWLPAIELHGEGIFIELSEEAVQEWEEKNRGVYQDMMQTAMDEHFRSENASPRYVLLHTLAHLLIRALAANCDY